MLLLVNFILFLDLYLVLINPFYSRRLREKKYWILLTINVPIVYYIVTINVINDSSSGILTDFNKTSTFLQSWQIYVISMYSLTTLIAIAVMFLLAKQGTSKDLKRKVQIRHVAYFFLYSLMFLNSLYDVFDN
jgi:hypothetical protein